MTVQYQHFPEFKKFLEAQPAKDRMYSNTRTKRAHYAAGGFGCKRQGVYEFAGFPELETDLIGRMVFRFGDAGQKAIEEEFINAKIFETREQSMETHDSRLQFPFSMRCDVIISLPKDLDPEQKMRPLEIKTSSASQFYDNVYKGWNGNGDTVYPGIVTIPKDYHLAQLNLYLKVTKTDWGVLVVINRDNLDYVVYKVNYDDELYERTVNHCNDTEQAYFKFKQTGELPPRVVDPLPLGVYKRDTKENCIGDAKLEKSSFPCIYRNKESNRYGFCKFFFDCHKEQLSSLNLTKENFK